MKWRQHRQEKLLFKCVTGAEFLDNGFFLDIGANHPMVISNSLHFEEIGWTGLAFEPKKHLADLWVEL